MIRSSTQFVIVKIHVFSLPSEYRMLFNLVCITNVYIDNHSRSEKLDLLEK